MGTSVNQRSPKTVNWRAANAAYTTPNIEINRAVQELWRAASNQPSGDLVSDLSNPIISECLRIVTVSKTREEAIRAATRAVIDSGRASLAADIAQRAVSQSFQEGKEKISLFTSTLFSQASNYLISRDLPGFVGANGRAKTVKEAVALKSEMLSYVSKKVAEKPLPKEANSIISNWKNVVKSIVSDFKGAAE